MSTEVTTLGELIALQRGYDLPEAQRRPGNVPVVGSAGITGYHDTPKAKGPGVTIGRSGASFGQVSFVREDYWPHNAALFVTDFKGNEPLFIRYLLESLDFSSLNSGSAQQSLNRNYVYAVTVRKFDLRAQRRIADILSAYDDLIENNQRRIRILEEMARSLYREWFVHFRFPGHNKVKVVHSSLGPIPNGWRVTKLGELVRYNRCATKSGPHLEGRRYVPIDCLPSKNLALLEAKPIDEAHSSLQLFEKRDILFGAMRPYFHKVVVAPFAGVTRTTCFVLKPARPEWHAFATMTAFEETTVAYANAHSQGATIPYAVWDGSLAEMPHQMPPDALLGRFEETVAPILDRIAQSFFILANLRRTRDLLLPRLLSGQINLNTL